MQVSTLGLCQCSGACTSNGGLHSAVRIFFFSARQAPDGDPRRVALHHLRAADPAQIKVQAPLDDAEQALFLRVLVRGDAAVEPSDRPIHRFLHPFEVRGRGGNHVVQLHHDVGADGVLQRDGMLGREQPGARFLLLTHSRDDGQGGNSHRRAVVRAEEAHALLGDFGQFQ